MLILTILDGVGIGDPNYKYNAVFQGQMPNFVGFLEKYPNCRLETSGLAVGLPEGQMGNSEVGHMTIGSGRVIYQDLPRINNAVKSGELSEKLSKIDFSQTVHIIGLCSSGGVHSSLEHILHIYNQIKTLGKTPILHIITDGRDVPPKDFITTLAKFDGLNIGTISGRFFAMDRDKRHERTQAYLDCILGKSSRRFQGIQDAVETSYNQDITDEFITPAIIGKFQGIQSGDSILIANFRADRVRQLTTALLDEKIAKNIICITHYSDSIAKQTAVLFPQQKIENTLSQILDKHHKKHLHIAETEKYAHVTFFFNGGVETQSEFEERILVPSPNVATYDLKPEMSIYELQEKLIDKINSKMVDFAVVNIANGDMVGHSGNFEAAKLAASHIDNFLCTMEKFVLENNHEMLITADHGNIEEMIDRKTGEIHTQHTMGVVPLIYIGNRNLQMKDGSLANIAGTVLELMGIAKSSDMEESIANITRAF
jgi:2,3-bisphosphoglycerate-independent phosphoglycerate mutase